MSEHQPPLPPLQFRVSDDEVHRRNERRLELMRLDQERDAVNKNLKAQHRLMVVTVLTALVALLSSTVAVYASLHSKPPIVNVTPHVIVK